MQSDITLRCPFDNKMTITALPIKKLFREPKTPEVPMYPSAYGNKVKN